MSESINVSTVSGEKTKKTKHNRWARSDLDLVLDYLIDTVHAGHLLEKPTAFAYYAILLTKVKLPTHLTPKLVRDKVINTRRQYQKAVKWSSQTGQGVKANEGELSFKSKVLRMCPTFFKCEVIWGSKVSIHVPYIAASNQIGNPEREDGLPHSDHEDDNDESMHEDVGSPSHSPIRRQSRSSPNEMDESPPGSRTSSPTGLRTPSLPGSRSPSPLISRSRSPSYPGSPSSPSFSNTSPSHSSANIQLPITQPSSQTQDRVKSKRKLKDVVKAGDKLSRVGKKPTTQDIYQEMSLQRERNSQVKLTIMERQLKLDETRAARADELERRKFEFEKSREKLRLESEERLAELKFKAESDLAKLRIRELKLKLLLKRAGEKV